MSSLNKVMLIGNVGKDPEIRAMQSGDKVASFSVATSERWKDKNTGERQEKSEWHKVVIFNQGLISLAENYIRKGTKVYVEGKMETRKWMDKEEKEHYSTEIVLKPFRGEIVLLGGKEAGEKEETVSRPAMSAPEEFEDEIPFNRIGGLA